MGQEVKPMGQEVQQEEVQPMEQEVQQEEGEMRQYEVQQEAEEEEEEEQVQRPSREVLTLQGDTGWISLHQEHLLNHQQAGWAGLLCHHSDRQKQLCFRACSLRAQQKAPQSQTAPACAARAPHPRHLQTCLTRGLPAGCVSPALPQRLRALCKFCKHMHVCMCVHILCKFH